MIPRLSGEEVRGWLKSLGKRQGWLAQQLGVSQASVSTWLNDNPGGCSASKRAQIDSMTRALMADPAAAGRGADEPGPGPASGDACAQSAPVPLAHRPLPPHPSAASAAHAKRARRGTTTARWSSWARA
jgi:hypothetical protein